MASIPADPGRSDESRRLDGWKDISAYLNRGVRTVQRWERQLGLPVRRKGQAGGEVVYAFASEIDAWLRTDAAHAVVANSGRDETRDTSAPPEPFEAVEAPPSVRVSRRFALVAVLLCLALFVPVWSVYSSLRNGGLPPAAGAPIRWEPTESGLRLLDADRQQVCDIEFGVPFDLPPYTGDDEGRRLAADRRGYRKALLDVPLVQLADVDGDGRREAVVIVKALDELKTSLRLYDDRCQRRWEYSASPHVRFGAESFDPPFHMFWVVVTPAAGGGHDLWLSRRHMRDHPSVLQRISRNGDVVGEYWHPGQITTVDVGRLAGRDVVAVGGVNNERRQAFVAILEKEPFGGVGPAEQEKYRCTSCRPGVPPLAYVLLPATELSRLAMGTPSVEEIGLHDRWLSVNVSQVGWGEGAASVAGMTAYELDPGLTPIRWEYTDSYAWVHDRLFEAGRVPARVDRATAPPLVPLVAWDGSRFREQ